MILVTGGAGFIGSNLHAALAARGLETVVVDWLGDAGKWRNLAKHPPAEIIPPTELVDFSAIKAGGFVLLESRAFDPML